MASLLSKVTLFVTLLLFAHALVDLGTMSMYHYSGTTFLNLRKISNPVSLEYEFRTFGFKDEKVHPELLKNVEDVLLPSVVETLEDGTHILKDTKFGDVTLAPGLIKLPKICPPNGNAKFQGWIEKDSDYYTPEQEDGDMQLVTKLFNVFDGFPTYHIQTRINVAVEPKASLLRDLMVNMYRSENRVHMIKDVGVQAEKSYTKDYLKRLLDVREGLLTYNPTMDELFNDFIILQPMDALWNGTENYNPWNQDAETVRKQFIKKKLEKLPLFGLDITPILLNYKPEDKVTKKVSKFVAPSNTVQFRELHGDVETSIRRAVGFVKVTELYGPIVADSAVGQVSFVETSLIKQIRKKLMDGQPVIIKYMVVDPEKCPDIYREIRDEEDEWYGKDGLLFGNIPTNIYGSSPLIIPGESLVWHQRTEHRFNILGKYNPSLINYNLAHFLENKYFEFLFFEGYCQQFLPKTLLLYNLLPEGTDPFNVPPELFVQIANKVFPDGWIIKGVWDYNGILHVTTFKDNFVKMINSYRNSTFDQVVENHKKNLPGCEPIEALNTALKDYPHFKGWKNNQYLMDSSIAIVQHFQKSEREYRIECFGGSCPKSAMTDDHRSVMDSKAKDNMIRTELLKFFNQCRAKFPDTIRGLPFTSDIAYLPGKKGIIVYETNPGGNSWLLHHEQHVATSHHKYMKRYPKKILKENVDRFGLLGLNDVDQMRYLQQLLTIWNLELPKVSRRFEILKERLTDHEHISMFIPSLARMNYTGLLIRPPKELDTQQKRFSISRFKQFYRGAQEDILEVESDDLMTALTVFGSLKNSYLEDDFEFIQKVIGELKFGDVFEDEMKNLTKWDKIVTDLSRKLLINLDEARAPAFLELLFQSIYDLHGMRFLNIKHGKLEEVMNKFWTFFLTLNFKNWNQRIVGGFDLLGYKGLDEMLLELMNHGKASLERYHPLLKGFMRSVKILYTMERTGFVLPGYTFSNHISHWLPRLRKFYPYSHKMQESTAILLSRAVATVVDHLSDHGLYRLHKETYPNEYDFFTDTLPLAIDESKAGTVGQVLHAYKALDCESDFRTSKISRESEFHLAFKQSKDGGWKNSANEPAVLDTMNAIAGMLSHGPSELVDLPLGELMGFDKYQHDVRQLGFLKETYSGNIPQIVVDKMQETIKNTVIPQ